MNEKSPSSRFVLILLKLPRGREMERRRTEREREMESDSRDRQKEKEELEELKAKIFSEGHSDPTATLKQVKFTKRLELIDF